MHTSDFLHLNTTLASGLIHGARVRILYCAPGLQLALAAAIVNARRRLGRQSVRVILDVSDSTARMGYGEFSAVELLREGDVDVRIEPGLRTGVLIRDDEGFAFFAPPMLVETQDDKHVGPNAMAMHPMQVQSLVASLLPSGTTGPNSPQPEVGKEPLTDSQLIRVKESLDANPPQSFDLARKVNVFNAFIEFVELKLTGLQIARHTVQLPRDLVLALRDDATAKRLMTTFKLVSGDSKVAKEAAKLDASVRELREKYTRSLGDGLGSVILRSKREALAKEVDGIRKDIDVFRDKVIERLDKELESSRRKLVDGLLPAVRNSTPPALEAQVSGKPTVAVLKRYLDDELKRVFPSAESLVSDMRLEWVPKGVTYETLSDLNFQVRVRAAFPYENWDKPFREFEAAPAEGFTRPLFD